MVGLGKTVVQERARKMADGISSTDRKKASRRGGDKALSLQSTCLPMSILQKDSSPSGSITSTNHQLGDCCSHCSVAGQRPHDHGERETETRPGMGF